MSVSLTKGANVSLSKEAASNGSTLTTVTLGLGWDARVTDGAAYDLDASAFVVDDSGKALSDAHFVFYGNLASPDGSVKHSGDNLTGAGDGDDEQITVDLTSLPANAARIVCAVTIYEAAERGGQNFGAVKNAFIRATDNTGTELARFDLAEEASLNTAVIFGELYKYGEEWKFKAVGDGFNEGLKGLCAAHGVTA